MKWLLPNRATRVIAGLVGVTLALCASLMARQGLTFPAGDAIQPLGVGLVLAGLAMWYERREVKNLAICFRAVLALVAFSTCYSVLMYAVAAAGWPLADGWLARLDQALGLSAGAVVQWTLERPLLARFFWLTYFSIIPQTIFAIVYLGLHCERVVLERFLARFMVSALLTAGGLYFAPALGSYASGDYDLPHFHAGFVEQLTLLRAGQVHAITWRDAEGLITFPSFHTVWGVLVVMAFAGRRRLVWPMLGLNLVMIVSTVTTGMHYFVDVAAGFAVVAVAVPLADWLTHGDGFETAWCGWSRRISDRACTPDLHPAPLPR